MNELDVFTLLKEEVKRTFQQKYPYFEGALQQLSSQDILNLIDDIQEKTKQTVSEKWVYTHLKPATNAKLPRKDMLDILAMYAGVENWDAFKFQYQGRDAVSVAKVSKAYQKYFFFGLGIVMLIVMSVVLWNTKNNTKIQFQNSFSKDTIAKKEIKAYEIKANNETEIAVEALEKPLAKPIKVVLKSPFYQSKTVVVTPTTAVQTIALEPNDYAMMLKAFMKSDIKDWQTRKVQLQKILSDDLEVMVMLKNDLGAEFFNKEEFAQKVIVPSTWLKQMTIVELKTATDHKIVFVRMTQD